MVEFVMRLFSVFYCIMVYSKSILNTYTQGLSTVLYNNVYVCMSIMPLYMCVCVCVCVFVCSRKMHQSGTSVGFTPGNWAYISPRAYAHLFK